MQVDRSQTPGVNPPIFRVPERIPVFPLPTVVFFPGTYLPLHIFEPRYRAMVSDAAAHGQCMGIVLLKDGWEEDYYGNPAVFDVGCVGRLVSVQRLPDGRFDILLQGLHRYDIQEQFFDKPYREARVVLSPRESHSALDGSVRSDLLSLVEAYLALREQGALWQGLLRTDAADEILVNSLSSYLDLTPVEKQFLLEAESLGQRARRLRDLIRFKVCERGGAKGGS